MQCPQSLVSLALAVVVVALAVVYFGRSDAVPGRIICLFSTFVSSYSFLVALRSAWLVRNVKGISAWPKQSSICFIVFLFIYASALCLKFVIFVSWNLADKSSNYWANITCAKVHRRN